MWYLNGNTLFECDDHLAIFEANRQDAALQAMLRVVNALVPGKRVTQVIQSHHHFDHTVGLRAAVAEGLTIIAQRGNEGIFREMAARQARLFPDALARNPKPLTFIPVDDHLKLKDSTDEVDIYHLIGNDHMADAVNVHVPASRLLVEGNLTAQDWDYNWWGDSVMNNIEYRKIKVDTHLPSMVRSRSRSRKSSQPSSARSATRRRSASGPPRPSSSNSAARSSTPVRCRRRRTDLGAGLIMTGARLIAAALLVLAGAGWMPTLAHQSPPGRASQGGPLALVGGTLIDGAGNPDVRNSVVLIRDERIERVGTMDALPVPPGL